MADERPSPPPAPPKAVDIRAGEIRTGAGLEEAKYDVEFIDFLRKWGTPIMLVILAAVAGWWGWQRYQHAREDELARAWQDYDAAVSPMQSGIDASPDVLLRVAMDHAGAGAVPLMARLAAADQYVISAAKGLAPGAALDESGNPRNADDVLADDKRSGLLTQATEQYETVLRATKDDRAKAMFALRSLFGLAAVAESSAQWDKAKAHYTAAKELASSTGFDQFASLAEARHASVDSLKDVPGLVPAAQIMSYNRPPETPVSGTPGAAPLTLDPNAGSALPPSGGAPAPSPMSVPITVNPSTGAPAGTPEPAPATPAQPGQPAPSEPVQPAATPAAPPSDAPKR